MVNKFDKIRQQVNSKLENQRIYGRTLTAIEETIQSQNEPLTPMAYFATIITTLETSSEANDVNGALLYLLDEVMPDVSQPVLRSKFDLVLRVLQNVYGHHQSEQPVVRSYVGCIQELLSAQDSAAWSTLQVQKAYLNLLTLGATGSPKARKRAQDAIRTILSRPPPPTAIHPASAITADFILRILRETSKNSQNDAQQILALLQTIVQYWPPRYFTDLCQILLQLPKQNNVFLTKAAFDVFDVLFDVDDTDLESDKLSSLLKVLVSLKPAAVDDRLLPSWLRMVAKAYTSFAKLDPTLCSQNLGFIFDLIFKDFKEPTNVLRQIALCLSALVRDCLTDDLIARTAAGENTDLANIIATTEKGLGVHFQRAWSHVMVVQEALFHRLHRYSATLMSQCLSYLGELRLSPNEAYKEQLDKTLGAAIAAMGPEQFLNILPLNLESATDVGRAFLLPLLKTYTSNTSLAYFANVLIPLGDRLAQEGQAAADRELEVQAKIYETLFHQIWSILPGFCDLPIDLRATFNDALGERLSTTMYAQPNLRPTIAKSLELLVKRNKALKQSDAGDEQLQKTYGITSEEASDNLEHMSKFAVSYLSVFFNMYGEIAPDARGFLTETIRTYLDITPKEQINETFKKVIGMLSQALETDQGKASHPGTNGPAPMSHTMLDLSIVMIPFLDEESATLLFNGTVTMLLDKEDAPILQKKAYKVLNILMQCPVGHSVISAHLGELQTKLVESVASCSDSAKKDRIQTLSHVVKLLPSTDLYFISVTLSEAILASKEMNEKTRAFAFTLLVEMGNKMKDGGMLLRSLRDPGDEDRVASLDEFIMMVTAGLAGTTAHFVSASITSLARIFFEFREDISMDMAAELLETVFECVKSNNREIVKAAIGYVKVCVVVVPDNVLSTKLAGVIEALLACSHQHRHFKVQIRHIFERLIRRCKYEEVEKLIPEADKKLIVNIQKRRLRAKRRKTANEDGDEEDEGEEDEGLQRHSANKMGNSNDAYEDVLYGSDSELDGSDDEALEGTKDTTATQKKSKRKPLADTFIREDGDADPLDFLDKTALGRISSAKPNVRKAKKSTSSTSSGFTHDMDGRLVIKDSDDEAIKASSSEGEQEDHYQLAQRSAEGFDRNSQNRIKFRKAGKADAMELDGETENVNAKRKKHGTRYEKVGKEFRSKKAGGDIKTSNKMDPYAYVPLGKVIKKRRGRQEGARLTFTGKVKK